MLLATFAVSVTYIARMSTLGGFWDDPESGHRPGDAILKDGHGKRLTAFLCFNAMAFVASLLIIVVLLDRKPRLKEAYGCIAIALISLIGAYTAGSCRETDTTIYVISLVGAVLAFIIFLQAVIYFNELHKSVSGRLQRAVSRTPSLRAINSRYHASTYLLLVLLPPLHIPAYN